MTAYTTTCEPSTTMLDILPIRGGKRGTVRWTPHSHDYAHGAGFVVIEMDRDRTAYAITEFPASVGRGFMLTKVGGPGTDKKMSGYAVLCIDGKAVSCECRGFTQHGHCKHGDGTETLLLNRWL